MIHIVERLVVATVLQHHSVLQELLKRRVLSHEAGSRMPTLSCVNWFTYPDFSFTIYRF